MSYCISPDAFTGFLVFTGFKIVIVKIFAKITKYTRVKITRVPLGPRVPLGRVPLGPLKRPIVSPNVRTDI